MSKLLSHTLIAAAALALAGAASATTLQLKGFSYATKDMPDVSVKLDYTGSTKNDKSYSGEAGQFSGTLDGKSFTSYCLDLYQTINFNTTYTYSAPQDLTNTTKANDIGRLLTKYLVGVDTAKESTAMQLSIWEILYETGPSYSLTNGVFTESKNKSGVRDLANSWLSDLGTTNAYKVQVLSNKDRQDQLFATAVPVPVPEPSTYALMLAGLGAVGFVARRRSPDAR